MESDPIGFNAGYLSLTLLIEALKGNWDKAAAIINTVMNSNKLPNGATFQDLLTKVANQQFKR